MKTKRSLIIVATLMVLAALTTAGSFDGLSRAHASNQLPPIFVDEPGNDSRGRTYTVTHKAIDTSGNCTQQSATIRVPGVR